MSGSDPPQTEALLEAAQGYAVFNRKGKRIGTFIELADDRIVIRHDGVFVWRARWVPLTAVAHVIPDQRAVVLTVDDLRPGDTDSPPSRAPRTSGSAQESHLLSDGWLDRVDRYVAAGEGNADEPKASREDTRHFVAGEADPPGAPTPAGNDRPADERHLLFISTPAGYSLTEQKGPAPRRGERIEIPGQATSFLVVKLGRSPLPNDRRSCAYVEPTAEFRKTTEA